MENQKVEGKEFVAYVLPSEAATIEPAKIDYSKAALWTIPQALNWIILKDLDKIGSPLQYLPDIRAIVMYPNTETSKKWLEAVNSLIEALANGDLVVKKYGLPVHKDAWRGHDAITALFGMADHCIEAECLLRVFPPLRATFEQCVDWCLDWLAHAKPREKGQDRAWPDFRKVPAHAHLSREHCFRPAFREAIKRIADPI